MRIEELMMHKKGNILEYQEAIDKRNDLKKKIGNLSNKIQNEDDSLSVFEGALSERDKELKAKHDKQREKLIIQREKKQAELAEIIERIEEMQR